MHKWVDHLVCNYIPMPKNTSQIVVNREAMYPLHFVPTCFSMPPVAFCSIPSLHYPKAATSKCLSHRWL